MLKYFLIHLVPSLWIQINLLNKFIIKYLNTLQATLASSGNLDDWYLAIKAEDFGTKKVKKPRAVERAEFELSKKVSIFNSKLSKILDEEEMQKLKDLRLIDNLITVKIQKDDNNDFEKDIVSRDKEKGEDQQEKKDLASLKFLIMKYHIIQT